MNNLTFSVLNLLKLNFSTTAFVWHSLIVYMVIMADTGNNRKIVNFTYSCLYAFENCLAIPKQLLTLKT